MKTITITKPTNYNIKEDYDDLLNIFMDEFKRNLSESKYIITNGNIISLFVDHPEFKHDIDLYMNTFADLRPFYVGEIFGMTLMQNPYTPWNDNRIVFKNDYISDDYIDANKYYNTNMIDVIHIIDDNNSLLT
ncbi:hypothetical protein M0Q50_02425 [bacterium]|jgi:hypothetical protein|nr:hypothetical protein [bacterium]